MIRIRRLLIRELLTLVGLAVALMLGFAWWALVRASNAQASAQAQGALDHLDREIRTRLEGAENLGDTAAALWTQGRVDPMDDATARALLAAIRDRELVTVLVLLRADGQGLFLDRRNGDWSATALRFREGRFWLQPVLPASGPAQPSPVDFRERPWYQLARGRSAGSWTEPYLFQRLQIPGISWISPVRDGTGQLLGVVDVDYSLEELSTLTAQLRPTEHSQVILWDRLGRALVLPPTPEFRTPEARHEAFLRPLAPDFLPEADALRRASRPEGRETEVLRIRAQGRPWFALHRHLDGPPGLHWDLGVAIPDEDLLGAARRKALAAMGLALAVLAALVWRVRRLADRLSSPLAALADSSDALVRGEPLDPPSSDIHELQHVGEAFGAASRALRERAELEEHLRRSQRLEMMGTMAAGIAHDLNNQLGAILGQLEMARLHSSPAAPHLSALQKAEAATLAGAEIAKSLLTFGRPTAPKLRPVDLNALVRESAMLVKHARPGKALTRFELDPGQPWTLAEPVQLEQVLMNLGVNARDAMPEGGTLTLRTGRDERGRPFVEVQDTGQGMSAEVQERIFTPFFTTKGEGKGTGLGLAMVFGIVKAHEGEIAVSSEPGRGSTFRVTLPPAPADTEPSAP